MKKAIIILFMLILVIIGLEINDVVPSTILPSLIALHDAIKANPNILVFVTNIKTFVANFEIKPYLDALDASLISMYTYITSLPWEKINIWYVLGIIFIIGVISEKFRTLSNEVKFINKKLARIKREIVSEDNGANIDPKASNTEDLRADASIIIDLLTDIRKTTDSLKSVELRSKKLRREIIQVDGLNNLEAPSIDVPIEKEEPASTQAQKSMEQLSTDTSKVHADDNDNDELDLSSDGISPLDLARTYIEANEIDNAESIIKKIVQTGTEHEKHEAKLLFMQLRK